AIRGHIRPGKIRSGTNLLQHLLKAADASKELGRKTNFVGKKLDEAARADADVVGKIGHSRSSMNVAKKTQRAIDRTMPFQGLERLLQQAFFKHVNFLLRRLRLKQALPQQSCFMAPQIFQRDVEIVQLAGRHFEKWKRAARFEVNADDRDLLGSINDKKAGMGAAEHRPGKPRVLVQVFANVNPRFILLEVD